MMWVNIKTHSVLSPEFSILRKRKDKAIESWDGHVWSPLDSYSGSKAKTFRTFEGAQAALKFIRKERL